MVRATAKTPAIDTVMADRTAISFMHFNDLDGAKPVALIDECGSRHRANPYTIRTEECPLSTRVYAMAQGNDATTFLNYAASADGQ